MKSFASDNYAGTSTEVIQYLSKINQGHEVAYGDDQYTKKAVAKFQEILAHDVDVYFVMNGTGANVTSLASLCRPHEAVICSDVAHINVDECGAPEKFIGAKLLTVQKIDGKLTIADIEPFLMRKGVEHWSQPKIVSITQTTEYGTVYTVNEIKTITEFCHKNGLYVHLDGARISNAVVSQGSTFKEMLTDTGIDIVSFGGTKNGLMFGEAVVFFNKELSEQYKYIRKQGMQLLSKMRFISSQFLAFFEDDLWKRNATHANKMAQKLANGLREIPTIQITQEVQANGIFAIIPKDITPKLQEAYPFYVWNEFTNEVRLMCSFDTTEEDVEGFLALANQYLEVKS